MSQDNTKEEKQPAQQQEAAKDRETKQEPPKAQTPKTEAPKTEAAKQDAPAAAEPAKAQAPQKEAGKISKERAVNCSVCNKSIRKKRYYYRNGKYFCTKRCWKTTVKKESKVAASDTAKA